jgi:hypothetical protein
MFYLTRFGALRVRRNAGARNAPNSFQHNVRICLRDHLDRVPRILLRGLKHTLDAFDPQAVSPCIIRSRCGPESQEMEKTIAVLNDLKRNGLVEDYAIAGAMAAAFYMEPTLTYDLDVFIALPPTVGPLMTLSPIYEFLRSRGCVEEHEHVLVEGVPVQFLPVHNPLAEESMREARVLTYGKTSTRVVRAEHLMAIMLQTYRPKDKARLIQMLEQAEFDRQYFLEVLKRHGLDTKWAEFRRQSGLE